MTCIIWHGNKLLTDSASVNGVEWTENGRKLIPVNGPIFYQETPESPPDPIVGFTFTHATKTAMSFLDMLEASCSVAMRSALQHGDWKSPIEGLCSHYGLTASTSLWNYENFFKALLIGRDKNYIFMPCTLSGEECGSEFVGFRAVDKSESIMLGSVPVKLILELNRNPKIVGIRAMHQAMHETTSVGGRVYEYEVLQNVTRDRGVEIACTGMWEAPDRGMLSHAPYHLTKPYPADLIYNKRSHRAEDRTLTKPGRTKPTDYQRYVRAHAAHFKLRQTKRK